MKTLMIYPKYPDTYWSFKHALKFISKKAAVPPLGLITVSAMLPGDWEKKLVDLNIEELKKSRIRMGRLCFFKQYVRSKRIGKRNFTSV